MAGKQAGRENKFQHVYFTSGFNGSLPREFQEVRSYTENISTGNTPDPQVSVSGRTRQLAAVPGATTFSLEVQCPTGAQDYRGLISGRSVGLNFTSDEIVLEAGGSNARAAIDMGTGIVTFTGNGPATDGAVHNAIQIGSKDYWIISIEPAAGKTEVSSNLTDNVVTVAVGQFGLNADVDAAVYVIIDPETETGTITGTATGPEVGSSARGFDSDPVQHRDFHAERGGRMQRVSRGEAARLRDLLMSIADAPSRVRTVEVGEATLYLRRPDADDRTPVIDCQVADRDAELANEGVDDAFRERLERASDERLAVTCVMICARDPEDDEIRLTYEQALEWCYEAVVEEDAPFMSSKLVTTAMALCRVGGVAAMVGKAVLESLDKKRRARTSRSPSGSASA